MGRKTTAGGWAASASTCWLPPYPVPVPLGGRLCSPSQSPQGHPAHPQCQHLRGDSCGIRSLDRVHFIARGSLLLEPQQGSGAELWLGRARLGMEPCVSQSWPRQRQGWTTAPAQSHRTWQQAASEGSECQGLESGTHGVLTITTAPGLPANAPRMLRLPAMAVDVQGPAVTARDMQGLAAMAGDVQGAGGSAPRQPPLPGSQ